MFNLFSVVLRFLYICYILLKYRLFSLFLNNENITYDIKSFNFLKLNVNNVVTGFEKLGPIFIKFGQILSNRPDFFNERIILELEKLQTRVGFVKFRHIQREFKKSFSVDIKDFFCKFNENPLSSASIAQIHSGILKTGEKVIVKVLKPNVIKLIKNDLLILSFFLNILIMFPYFKRFKLLDVLEELKATFEFEVNFKNEACHISKFDQISFKNKLTYVPKVFWHLTSKSILTLEYLDGINILNVKKLKKENINIDKLSFNFVKIFYLQFLRYNFFHADLHPGNILISKNSAGQSVIILLDFGIVGFVEESQKYYIIENMLAFFDRDYRKVVYLHLKAKTIQTKLKIEEIENDLRFIFDPIVNKDLVSISFRKVIMSILSFSSKVNMQIQPNFLLFQKNLFSIESIIRRINPKINLWLITRRIIEQLFLRDLVVNKVKGNFKKEVKLLLKDSIVKIKKVKKKKVFFIKVIDFLLSYTFSFFLIFYSIFLLAYIPIFNYNVYTLYFV